VLIYTKSMTYERYSPTKKEARMLLVTQSRLQLFGIHKKKEKRGLPRRIATMVLPKKERKESPGDAEETVSMAFT